MDIFVGLIVFLMIWWLTLFTVLPWGITNSGQEKECFDPGSPDNPRIKEKFIITTVISVVLWIIVYIVMELNLINFYDLASDMIDEDYRP